ncbi:MAG: SpoIIIAH-like family protein [Oscillospiraceae bacterium]|nr:SpoIIIAH-like family protein [Oscillospiraceae bacterium]
MKKWFGKKQVILGALVVALGVAVYLNYYFSSHPALTDAASRGNLGDAAYVSDTTAPSGDDTATGNTYFDQARQSRATARQEAMAIIGDVFNNVEATDQMKNDAAVQTAAIAQAVEQESNIESLIKAKGFSDCVVYINGSNCQVVVEAETLTAAQVAQITDIITTSSSITAANIHINNMP